MRAVALAIWMLTMAQGMGAQELPFSALNGWDKDDHQAALQVFLKSCPRLSGPEWQPICQFAQKADDTPKAAKAFFEMLFRPVQVGQTTALFTGYFEPELKGAREKTGPFKYPLYAVPKDLKDGTPYLTRAAIEAGALRGKGLEIAWVEDPVDAFFLQIQGSGRIILPNGKVLRLGYAARNGHAYASVGQELVARGAMQDSEVSAAAIRAYVKADSNRVKNLLNVNPSYVFFREIKDLSADDGPIGALSLPITAHRSIAVDPAFVPLGAPVWVEKAGDVPFNRLMVAQDTGGAIKGAQRADIFFGTGAAAGEAAGQIRDSGRMIQLLPNDTLAKAQPQG